MRYLKILLFSFLICSSLSAQSDYDCNSLISYKYNLNGRIEEDYKITRISGNSRSIYYYDDTLLINIKKYSDKNLLLSEVFNEYSPANKLVKSTEKHYYDYPVIVEGRFVFEYTPSVKEEITAYEYNESGNETRWYSISNPGEELTWEKVTQYIDNLPVLEICNPDDTSDRRFEIHYTYDTSGKKKKVLSIYPDTTLNSEDIYIYDKDSRLLKTESYYDNKLQIYEKYVYNSRGLLIEINSHQPANEERKDFIFSKIRYDYDLKGRLIKECYAQYTYITTDK